MLGALIVIGAAVGLMKFGLHEAIGPSRSERIQRARLVMLSRFSDEALTLDEAEDGAVLSRRFQCPELEKRFAARAQKLRRLRNPV